MTSLAPFGRHFDIMVPLNITLMTSGGVTRFTRKKNYERYVNASITDKDAGEISSCNDEKLKKSEG